MKIHLSTSAFGLALLLSACSGNSTVSQDAQTQSNSSAGVRISVGGNLSSQENVLLGSSSSSDVGIDGYQVQANRLFVSKYAGMEPSAATSQDMQNGSTNGFVSYDTNGNVISTTSASVNGSVDANARYDENGNPINRNGTSTNGTSNSSNGTSTNGSSRTSSGNPSTYSYISGCDYSFLQRLGLEGQCGSPGWTFPGLVGGECPVTACILNVDGETPFGPL